MPPIPLHKNDPITAAKPDGITPQTADPSHPTPTRTTPAATPATTTESASSPPAPQPGARPIAPTGSASTSKYSPPAPQPGATPGYTATHVTTETRLAGPPPQFSVPPPSDAQLQGRSTTTSTQASKPGPTQLNMGAAPPGPSPYQEEHRGGSVLPVPRSVLEGPPGYVQVADNTPEGTGREQGPQSSAEEGGVGAAAWGLLAKAGEALKKGEEAAWRAVRKP